MADRSVVVCKKVLCFVVSKHCYKPTSLKTFKIVLTDFYSVDELAAAKLLLRAPYFCMTPTPTV